MEGCADMLMVQLYGGLCRHSDGAAVWRAVQTFSLTDLNREANAKIAGISHLTTSRLSSH